jgi:oligosaccharyltransferase complex subunit gamma
MRLLYLLSVALGSIGSVEAASGNKFQKFRALAKPSIELDDSSFTDLTSKPRDYHVAVLLTAMEARYGCQVCRDFAPEWELLARSWNKLPSADTKVLFGTLDFGRGRNTFQKVRLLPLR